MRRIGLALGLVVITSVSILLAGKLSSAETVPTDPWVQVMGNGFGDPNNLGIATLHSFQDQLYAVTNRRDNAPATFGQGEGQLQLWRSPDGQKWTRVTSFSPPLTEADHAAFFMLDSGPTPPQYVYLSTIKGIYRSVDGASWTQINGSGSGFDMTGNKSMTALVVKESGGRRYLYAGTNNDAGAQVWRIPFDATTGWQKLLDFAAVDPNVVVVTQLYAWRDAIYVATQTRGTGRAGAPLYSSASGDPGTWVKNPGVGDGFGDVTTLNLADIVDFNGFLYVTTQNRVTGGQLWRSADGQTWSPVVKDGFGNPLNAELHRLAVAYGQLWVTTFSLAPVAAQIWRSSDGLTFTKSNLDGFGDSNTFVGYPPIIGFKDWVYWGGQNKITGGQLWRLSAAQVSPPPSLATPPSGTTLTTLGTTLSWSNPAGSTQYQLQVIPANNDGPGINVIRNAEASFTVQPPVLGQGPYVMLPGMSYTWRVRTTAATAALDENSPLWRSWSEARTFRTPVRDSSRLGLVAPATGSMTGTAPQTLRWDNGDKDVFYYEVQVSPDLNFGEAGPVASVWHNLVHGGVSTPLNSWTTPNLEPGTTYYWQVRPRVQGDGTPVAWSQAWSFRAQ